MLKLQQTFVIQLFYHWMQGTEIIFIDEASCDPWDNKIKTWMDPKLKFKLDLVPNMNKDKKRVQVIGAISNK